jgi:hypothetical protein
VEVDVPVHSVQFLQSRQKLATVVLNWMSELGFLFPTLPLQFLQFVLFRLPFSSLGLPVWGSDIGFVSEEYVQPIMNNGREIFISKSVK